MNFKKFDACVVFGHVLPFYGLKPKFIVFILYDKNKILLVFCLDMSTMWDIYALFNWRLNNFEIASVSKFMPMLVKEKENWGWGVGGLAWNQTRHKHILRFWYLAEIAVFISL